MRVNCCNLSFVNRHFLKPVRSREWKTRIQNWPRTFDTTKLHPNVIFRVKLRLSFKTRKRPKFKFDLGEPQTLDKLFITTYILTFTRSEKDVKVNSKNDSCILRFEHFVDVFPGLWVLCLRFPIAFLFSVLTLLYCKFFVNALFGPHNLWLKVKGPACLLLIYLEQVIIILLNKFRV